MEKKGRVEEKKNREETENKGKKNENIGYQFLTFQKWLYIMEEGSEKDDAIFLSFLLARGHPNQCFWNDI